MDPSDGENIHVNTKQMKPALGMQGGPQRAATRHRDGLTEAKTPHLETKQRARMKEPMEVEIEEVAAVKEPVQVRRGSTKPITPRLSYAQQKYQKHDFLDSPEERSFTFKARPMPDMKTPSPLRASTECAQMTIPEPFHLSESNRRDRSASEAAEVKKFRARQIMSENGELPFIPIKQPTVPAPFHLKSEELHMRSKDKFHYKLEKEDLELQEKRCFRARPLPDMEKIWKPEAALYSRPSKSAFVMMQTDRRAAERNQWEEMRKRVELEAKQQEVELREERRRLEELELKEYRKGLKFKARQPPKDPAAGHDSTSTSTASQS